jgi:hypothetical protein
MKPRSSKFLFLRHKKVVTYLLLQTRDLIAANSDDVMLTENPRTGNLPVTNRKSKSIKRVENQFIVVNPVLLSDIQKVDITLFLPKTMCWI